MINEKELADCLKMFGHSSFLPGQKETVMNLLEGRDTFCLMPTGNGKSLCFQLPAMLQEGLTIVVSPLISLMHDQVEKLLSIGVPAGYIDSTMEAAERNAICRNLIEYKLLYVSPERLAAYSFRSAISHSGVDVSMLIIDEAHCVSKWGKAFRPEYDEIPEFVEYLRRRPVIGAFTATASPSVQKDIIARLRLKEPALVYTGFDRPNLIYAVRDTLNRERWIKEFTASRGNECGIIYCMSRKNVDWVFAILKSSGRKVSRYHGGMDMEHRMQNQEDFMSGKTDIMVATNAFGMGVNRIDVRYVIHYDLPMDMDSYCQEAGRAGRDGKPAFCCILTSNDYTSISRYLISRTRDYATMSRQLHEFDKMERYSRLRQDHRKFIINYFTGKN